MQTFYISRILWQLVHVTEIATESVYISTFCAILMVGQRALAGVGDNVFLPGRIYNIRAKGPNSHRQIGVVPELHGATSGPLMLLEKSTTS